MKRYVTGILVVLALVFVLGISAWFWLPQPKHETAARELPTTPTIETEHPGERNFSQRLHWFGRVESKVTVKLMSLVSGQVNAVKAADGALVQRGTVLFIIGGSRVTSRLESLEQRRAAIKKQVSLAVSIVRTMQNAAAEKIMKREELLAAQEQLAQLRGELARVTQELAAFQDAMSIRSPMDGVFTHRRVSAGQPVEEGVHLADVISTDLRVVAYLFPTPGISLEDKTVMISTGSREHVIGSVKRVLPVRTPNGATIVWIEGEEINTHLKPGETVGGNIVLKIHKKELSVPRDAVVRDNQGRTFVFVREAHGYRRKAVKTGLARDGWIEIISGISQNEEIVVRGAYELFYQNFGKTYKGKD